MNENDADIIMTNAIDALKSLELSNYGGAEMQAMRKADAMHNILIIIEQVRQARKRNLEGGN
jgi:hypothetical protein